MLYEHPVHERPVHEHRAGDPLIQTLARARRVTDALFGILAPHAMYSRPVDERHRLIFYLGHLEAFDWNQIARGGLGVPSFHPEFDRLFEFGIDPPVGSKRTDVEADWPALERVQEYSHRVRGKLDELSGEAPEALLHVAIEHRLMHAETLAYLFHRLPADLKHGPAPANVGAGLPPENPMIEIPAGEATLGISSAAGFGWCNEHAEHRVAVNAFRISRYKISNGEYLAFVKDGGPAPPFWRQSTRGWELSCMFGTLALPLDWPVWTTHQQASAYAVWRGMRLPSEAEFHRAAFGTPQGGERSFPWGEDPPEFADGNFDFRSWDPIPVNATPGSESAFGVAQLTGNGWEWTCSPFQPFEGFKEISTYPGYSANFFDGQHYVLKGASPRTAARLLRRSFRNWFRPDYPHVYAGFHLVQDDCFTKG